MYWMVNSILRMAVDSLHSLPSGGDGTYKDEQGRTYGVDAGLIGCINVKDITPSELENLKDGHVVEFVQDFSTFSAGGIIRIGSVCIDTDFEEIEEEVEDEIY